MDPWSTHFPVLSAVLHKCKYPGPVLELGCGWYSTFMLHLMCKGTRELFTVENDLSWISKFKDLEAPGHTFVHVSSWNSLPLIEKHDWSVALVDCHPPKHRGALVSRLKERCKFIVIHDSEPQNVNVNNYQILSSFKHRVDFTRFMPHTTVVSQWEEFDDGV